MLVSTTAALALSIEKSASVDLSGFFKSAVTFQHYTLMKPESGLRRRAYGRSYSVFAGSGGGVA
jgi:hypothetical protein